MLRHFQPKVSSVMWLASVRLRAVSFTPSHRISSTPRSLCCSQYRLYVWKLQNISYLHFLPRGSHFQVRKTWKPWTPSQTKPLPPWRTAWTLWKLTNIFICADLRWKLELQKKDWKVPLLLKEKRLKSLPPSEASCHLPHSQEDLRFRFPPILHLRSPERLAPVMVPCPSLPPVLHSFPLSKYPWLCFLYLLPSEEGVLISS